MMDDTRLSHSILMAPVSFRLNEQGMPPTTQFGCGLRPPKMVWIFTISRWKSSASR